MSRIRSRTALVVASTLIGLGITAGPAVAATDASTAVGVNGVVVSKVLFDGRLMTLSSYEKVQQKTDAAGGSLTLVVDGSAATRGYLVAFSSDAAASSYMQEHGMGALPTSLREPVREAATKQRRQALASSTLAAASAAAVPAIST